ncbi:N-acetylglucosamine kinase [Acetobacter sp. LMG 1636]|uniref:N-acetylglucosamine kinase n=1 Tax=Acetobacter fallax TaxID=1737473 RepID=A0ABX0KFP2_9PROT|nr:N-acetylglucosamine kinase [Acetobacter fallax]NHO37491.1 N-acetylglucosamine kinase [Acetobacter fallax]
MALDGGGSKTLLIGVLRDATVLVRRVAGGSNPFDQPCWADVIAGIVRPPVPFQIRAAAFGMAGHGESTATTRQQDDLAGSLLPVPVRVRNDVEMACLGAFGGGPGVLLLSGTGSMAWARGADGRNIRVGGWGPLFGDEGSAFWIGREALSLLTQALDGRDVGAADLVEPVCCYLGLTDEGDGIRAALLAWYSGLDHERSAVAAVARCMGDLAAEGNLSALALIDRAAAHLARHVSTARAALSNEAFVDQGLPWSHGGGTFASAALLDAVERRCGASRPPLLPPVGGAVLEAAGLAGWGVDAAWISRLAAGLTNGLSADGLSEGPIDDPGACDRAAGLNVMMPKLAPPPASRKKDTQDERD